MDVHRGPTRSRTAPMGSAETYHQLLPFLLCLIPDARWSFRRKNGTYIGDATSNRKQEIQSRILSFTCFPTIA